MRRITGIILLIVAVMATINLIRKETVPEAARRTGNASYDRGQQVGRYLAPILAFGLGLWTLLGSGGTRPAQPPKGPRSPTGRSPATPSQEHQLHGDYNTVASNPASLKLNYASWLAANPSIWIIVGCMVLLGAGVAFFKVMPGLVLMGAGLLFGYRALDEARHKYRQGDVCPGAVLSAQARLVAVMTDLSSTGGPPQYAIKVLRQPLHRFAGTPASDGMRVATVALYHGTPREPTWRDFSPEVINCVVGDEDEIQRVLYSIDDEQWQALDDALGQLPSTEPGLYRIGGAVAATGAPTVTPFWRRRMVRYGAGIFGGAAVLIALLVVAGWWMDRSRTRRFRASAPSGPFSHPAGRDSIGLRDRVVTVTNNMGVVLKDIELRFADQLTLTYAVAGREQRVPLSTLPLAFLDSLGIPKDWPGYRHAELSLPQPAPGAVPGGSRAAGPTPTYAAGQKVLVQRSGRWIPGTVIEPFGSGGFSYRVQLNDPEYPRPFVTSTGMIRTSTEEAQGKTP